MVSSETKRIKSFFFFFFRERRLFLDPAGTSKSNGSLMMERIETGDLKVAAVLHDFVTREALPGTGMSADAFWGGFGALVQELAPRNRALLQRRDELQARIDAWHREHAMGEHDQSAYEAFLREIGYLVPAPAAFSVDTANVDPEIASIAGPQLVVPISNARYALNAANARWGSLFDALYGTDAIPDADGATRGHGYNAARGARVVARAKALLDEAVPLAHGSHARACGYAVRAGALVVALDDGEAGLAQPGALVGYRGAAQAPDAVLLRHHGLHLELVIDRAHPIGRTDPAGLADLVLESAVTTIADCEDSVAAVDAGDKVDIYRAWLGLMRGTLEASFAKGGGTVTRRLNEDRRYTAPGGRARWWCQAARCC